MLPLDKTLRNRLERAIKEARETAEAGAKSALEQFGVGDAIPPSFLSEPEKALRRRLRVHGRQLGDAKYTDSKQAIDILTEEIAYEHWHRMLFARFLAENDLLMDDDPNNPVSLSLEDCEALATEQNASSAWELAARYASRMLPQIFRTDSPVFQLNLPPEHQHSMEKLLTELPPETFTASDALGWVYQFWQAKKKDDVNKSEVKIGARELPAVTQLFTEPYMVQFLLDNSLGAWWASKHLSEDDLKNAKSEDELREKAAIQGVPLTYLRFTHSNKSFQLLDAPPTENELVKKHGEYLPHWTTQNAIYHVCFRLYDSLPTALLLSYEDERTEIIQNAKHQNRPLSLDEEKKLKYLYSDKIAKFLDSGSGSCFMKDPKISEIVANALKFFDGNRYKLHAWCVMPNHVHVIVEPINGNELFKIIHSWKSFSANKANTILNRSGDFWQHDSYNHIIRNEKELYFQLNYVYNNPEKAGYSEWKDRCIIESINQAQDELVAQFNTSFQLLDKPDQDGLVTHMGWRIAAGTYEQWAQDIKDLKILDPCCGSGHFLVATLRMLVPMLVTVEMSLPIPAIDWVLQRQLYGLELDKRCVEIAVFALALAAWTYPEIGGYRTLPQMNIACCGLSVGSAKEEWTALANGNAALRQALTWLHDFYQDAPVLGSLLNPKADKFGEFIRTHYPEYAFDKLLGKVRPEEEMEAGLAAKGLLDATLILMNGYDLVITNVPYLARGKQNPALQKHCEKYFSAAKNDLATVFLDRCLQLCHAGGTASIVLPQNWLFLTSYKKFREKLLLNDTWHLVARLGPGAFETISGEVVKAILLLISKGQDGTDEDIYAVESFTNKLCGLDVSEFRSAQEKGEKLIDAELKVVSQARQLKNPDAMITSDAISTQSTLGDYALCPQGIATADDKSIKMQYWELSLLTCEWSLFFEVPSGVEEFSAQVSIVNTNRLKNAEGANFSGKDSWGKRGVLIGRMNDLPTSHYTGQLFKHTAIAVTPIDNKNLTAIYAFCSSSSFSKVVRQLNQGLAIDNGLLVKVPFDFEHWQKVAAEKYPNGLPEPYSDDPTQWIFHGHPCGSVVWSEKNKKLEHGKLRTDNTVLHVAIARLLGYQWPAEHRNKSFQLLKPQDQDSSLSIQDQDDLVTLSEESRFWVKQSQDLLPFADDDGIVCISPVRGEESAMDRIINLLAAAYGDKWSPAILAELLAACDHAGKSLESWLRDKFFAQHSKLFMHRPFIWQIWDGLRDGFSALVNYHSFDNRKLQSLIYSYLGDWITRQKHDLENSIDGASEKLAAAEILQKKLILILEGEPPYDIFVRWKSLEKQAIGWNPDLNDGVRMNIRPFVKAEVLRYYNKPILNINWDKDRGKDVPSAPWYHIDKGDRINDRHLSLEEKQGV